MTPVHPAQMRRQLVRPALIFFAWATSAFACAREPRHYRGAGLQVDTLPVNDVVGVYRAALGSAFTLSDPALSLLVDPLLLPRNEGLAGGDMMPSPVRSALERARLVKGNCQVPLERTSKPLVCRADRPGYVVRLSTPFALGPRHDSVQVHLVVQQYAIPKGPVAERLRFERAYHVARSGRTWRAVREARLPQP